MTIIGKVGYQNLFTGFWGIIDKEGKKWRAVNMPKELCQEGLSVEIEAQKADEQISMFMWGTPISIVSFKIN